MNSIVFNEDCMIGMARFPDKYFDLAVVDPPYFSGPERRSYYGSEVSTQNVRRVKYPVVEKWEVPGADYFHELERVAKRYIVWGCNYFDYRFAPGRIVWDKCNGQTTFSDCEIAATNIHDSVRLYRYMWNGMMQGKSVDEGHIMRANKVTNDVRIHPTQKPIDLYRWIFRTYAKEGQRILDTHVGSGTSRRAAWDYRLEFIGFEIEKTYYDMQELYYDNHTAQQRMEI